MKTSRVKPRFGASLPATAALVGLLAGLACAPAQAQVNLTASASNLRYTVIDLDPNDGLAPSVNFTVPQDISLVNKLSVDRPGQQWSSEQVVSSPTTIDHDLGATAHTTVAYDGQGVQAAGYLARNSGAGASFSLTAGLPDQAVFTLSPHTGIQFSLDVAVDLVLGGSGNAADGGWGSGQLLLIYQRSDDHTWDGFQDRVAGYVGKGDMGEFVPQVHLAKTATFTWNNNGDVAELGALDYYATVEGNVSPVPEPGEWAMLGVGAGLLGWRARRKQSAA